MRLESLKIACEEKACTAETYRTIEWLEQQIKLIDVSSGDYWLRTLHKEDLSESQIGDASSWALKQIELSEFTQSGTATTYDKIELTFINTPIIGRKNKIFLTFAHNCRIIGVFFHLISSF